MAILKTSTFKLFPIIGSVSVLAPAGLTLHLVLANSGSDSSAYNNIIPDVSVVSSPSYTIETITPKIPNTQQSTSTEPPVSVTPQSSPTTTNSQAVDSGKQDQQEDTEKKDDQTTDDGAQKNDVEEQDSKKSFTDKFRNTVTAPISKSLKGILSFLQKQKKSR